MNVMIVTGGENRWQTKLPFEGYLSRKSLQHSEIRDDLMAPLHQTVQLG